VYEVTGRPSFEHIDSWITDFRQHCPDATIVLVGNKADGEAMRAVPLTEAEAFAAARGLRHFEASAKTGFNVDAAFIGLAGALRAQES
jgi:Ras-related protein Rab-11A